jgi:hypothetical protein
MRIGVFCVVVMCEEFMWPSLYGKANEFPCFVC